MRGRTSKEELRLAYEHLAQARVCIARSRSAKGHESVGVIAMNEAEAACNAGYVEARKEAES